MSISQPQLISSPTNGCTNTDNHVQGLVCNVVSFFPIQLKKCGMTDENYLLHFMFNLESRVGIAN